MSAVSTRDDHYYAEPDQIYARGLQGGQEDWNGGYHHGEAFHEGPQDQVENDQGEDQLPVVQVQVRDDLGDLLERPSLANAKLRVRAARDDKEDHAGGTYGGVNRIADHHEVTVENGGDGLRRAWGLKERLRALGVNILINPMPFKNRPAKV